jgi:hypothetical protein
MLDLPNLSIAKTAFPLLESELSKYIILYTKELLELNCLEEVSLYSEKEEFDYKTWLYHHNKKSEVVDGDLLPLLTIAYDMALQKHSSGHLYDSHSSHAIPIGVLSNLPLGVAVLNKHCRICSANPEGSVEHDCFANFEVSSGTMESAALVQLAHTLFDELLLYNWHTLFLMKVMYCLEQ